MDRPGAKPRHHSSGNRNAKKGGGGGKHTWGKIGDEQNAKSAVDRQDPNYNSDDDMLEKDVILKEVVIELTEAEIEEAVIPEIKEYFDTGDVEEFKLDVGQLQCGALVWRVAELLVTMSIERTDAERELTSILLSDLYSNLLKEADIELAFERVLVNLADLKLDIPDAPEAVGKFLARAVADDILAPAFITHHPAVAGDFANPHIRAAIKKANTLVTMKHGMARLDQVWGVHGSRKPVKVLVNNITQILEEYLEAEDCEEVQRLLHELGVPHFHHEVVYEALNIAISNSHKERIVTLIINLLQIFSQSNFFTPNQIEGGFVRVFKAISDIALDVPNAHKYLEDIVNRCVEQKIISAAFAEKAPGRENRKRYLSEGDGGKIKE